MRFNPAKSRPGAVIVALLTAVAIAACGGDDEDESTPAETADPEITRDEWVARADDICAATNDNIDRLPPPQSVTDLGATAIGMQGFVASELTRLRGLPVPPEITDQVEEMLALQAEEVDSFDLVREAAATGKRRNFAAAASEASAPGAASNQIATELGLQECDERHG